MKYTVEVHGIKDSRTTFDDDKKGLAFVKTNIDWAVKNHIERNTYRYSSGAYRCR